MGESAQQRFFKVLGGAATGLRDRLRCAFSGVVARVAPMSSGSKLLRQIEKSPLAAADFPIRARFSHAEWSALSDEERSAAHQPGHLAIERVRAFDSLVNIVRELGTTRFVAAVPVLAKLWRDCALVPVRVAAGHALRAIGTPEARAALEREIEDANHLSVFLAVRAIFDADPSQAFERLIGYFEPVRVRKPGGSVIPSEILTTFCPSSYTTGRGGKEQPQWSEPRAPAWFTSDRRWMDLCISLRKDALLGRVARDALRHADQAIVSAALDAAHKTEAPPVVAVRSVSAGDLVSRYMRGEHEAVWRELRVHESIEGEFRQEALHVARVTMARVARAADMLAERLAKRGWRALSGALRTPPSEDDGAIMLRVERATGAPLPPSMREFWEVVGGIDFVWDYHGAEKLPDLGVSLDMDQMDPLSVESPRIATELFEEWDYHRRGVNPELADPFNLDLAADCLHKANISGGPPYGIELPFHGVDPIFVNEEHRLPFVEYLRLCFRWGGFPRLERHANEPTVRAFVAAMTAGLEPF